MKDWEQRVREHCRLTRRYFFHLGSAAAAAWTASPLAAANPEADPRLRKAVAELEYLTPLDCAHILDKGKAGVAKLPPERLGEIGLLPETWSLDVVPDPASDSSVEQLLSRVLGNALDWNGLMRLAEKHAVCFRSRRHCRPRASSHGPTDSAGPVALARHTATLVPSAAVCPTRLRRRGHRSDPHTQPDDLPFRPAARRSSNASGSSPDAWAGNASVEGTPGIARLSRVQCQWRSGKDRPCE